MYYSRKLSLTGRRGFGHTKHVSILIFFLGFGLGGFFEYVFAMLLDFLEKKPLRINHHFTVLKRISLLSLPVWGLIAILFTNGTHSYVNIFLMSAIIGTILEGMLGKFIHRFFGVRIWTYKYGSIGNFTSLYSLPYWGAAGLVFVSIGKFFGL